MKTRPLTYKLVSLILVGIAVSFPLQILLNYELGFDQFGKALSFLPSMNLLLMLTLAAQAVLTWNASRGLLVLAPLTVALVTYNNFLVGSWGYDYSLSETWVASATFLVFQGHLLLPVFYKAFRNPSVRWWMVPIRKAIEIPIRVSPVVGQRFHSFTSDMSETGAFIESQDDALDIGDQISLSFSVNSVQPLQVVAEVVRKGENQRQDRAEFGYGVRFQQLNPNQKKTLDRFLGTH